MKKIIYFLFTLLFSHISYSQILTATGQLNVPRWSHQSQLLYNGKVLVFGGDNGDFLNSQVYRSSEIYNSGSWTYSGAMKKRRTYFASVVLPNGNIMAIGGDTNLLDETSSCEIYNVTTGTWTFADSMNEARMQHEAVLLNNGKVLVIGGKNGKCEIYDPVIDHWSYTGSNLNVGDDGTSLILLNDGRVLATLDQNAEIYDPASETWTSLSNHLNGHRFSHSSVLLNNGNVLLSGSSSFSDQNTAEIFNPVLNGFTSINSMSEFRANSQAILMDNGNVLVFGIGDFFNPTDTKLIEVYNSSTGQWTSSAYNQIGTQGYTIHKLANGKILIIGGSFTTGNGASRGCALIDQNIGPCTQPNLNLAVNGSAICYGNSSSISIQASEAGLLYQAFLGVNPLTALVNGGGNINLGISKNLLTEGSNIITVRVYKNSCPSFLLADSANINALQAFPNPSIFHTTPVKFCQGDSVILEAPSGYNLYHWTNGETSQRIKIKINSTVAVKVTDVTGCTSRLSDSITVSTIPSVTPQITINISSGQNPSVENAMVSFSSTILNGGSNPIYHWKVNGKDAGITSAGYSTDSLKDNDQIVCMLISNAGCAKPTMATSNSITIVVNPPLPESPKVTSVNPKENETSANNTQNMSINFSMPMSISVASSETVKVYGSLSGLKAGSFSLNPVNGIQFDPTKDFAPGEKITTIITKDAKNTNGINLLSSYSYDFLTKVSPSSGSFQEIPTISYQNPEFGYSYASKIVSGDYNGDGLVDLATIIMGAEYGIAISLNRGSGVFDDYTVFGNIDYYGDIRSADFDLDGDLDLVVKYLNADMFYVLFNNGKGHFTIGELYNTTSGTNSISFGDFDGDGDFDIVSTNGFNIGSKYINNGHGVFSSPQTNDVSPNSYFSGFADIDKDGDIDLIVSIGAGTKISKNDGTGAFSPTQLMEGITPHTVLPVDIDSDGDLDLICAGNTIVIYKNDGSGFFQLHKDLPVQSAAIHCGDYNGDGIIDLATVNNSDKLTIIYNNSAADFSTVEIYDTYNETRSLTAADFDGDNILDIAVSSWNDKNVAIFYKNLHHIVTSFDKSKLFCKGAAIKIPFKVIGNFNPANTFTAQLSDANGDFTTAVNLSNPVTGNSDDTIRANLPSSLVEGTNYRIRVVSTNPIVEGASNAIDLSIANDVPEQPSLISGNVIPCSQSYGEYSVTLSNKPSSIFTWSLIGDGQLIDLDEFNYHKGIIWNNNASGDFIITCTPSNGCGSGVARTFQGNVSTFAPLPDPIQGPKLLCNPEGATYMISNPVAGVDYTWYRDGNSIGTGSSVTIDWLNKGHFSVGVMASNHCFDGPGRSLDVTIGMLKPNIILNHGLLYAQIADAAISCEWKLNGNTIGDNSPSLEPILPGNYKVIITDPTGICKDSSEVFIYTPNGISYSLDSKINIYPNPAESFVNVNLTGNIQEFEIIIENSLGVEQFRKTYQTNNPTSGIQINSTNLSKGVYTLRVKSGNEFTIKKLVIN